MSDTKPYECYECERSFKSHAALIAHKRDSHGRFSGREEQPVQVTDKLLHRMAEESADDHSNHGTY